MIYNQLPPPPTTNQVKFSKAQTEHLNEIDELKLSKKFTSVSMKQYLMQNYFNKKTEPQILN